MAAWLDMLMQGFTQIVNGLVSVALALILFFAGPQLLAYELILGPFTLWLVVELAKALVHRRRPFSRLSEVRIVGQRAGGVHSRAGTPARPFSWRR